MNLETPNITIKKSQKKLFEFLCDLNNFEQLMPENTQKFEVDGDSFIFGLKGMPEIRLVLQEKTAYNQIVLGPNHLELLLLILQFLNQPQLGEKV